MSTHVAALPVRGAGRLLFAPIIPNIYNIRGKLRRETRE